MYPECVEMYLKRATYINYLSTLINSMVMHLRVQKVLVVTVILTLIPHLRFAT
jgi:hypothetical protein